MSKRGQFYLVAAIIITVVIMGIVSVSNYSTKPEATNIDSLKDQVEIESAKTIDYGIHQQLTQSQISDKLKDFTQQYINAYSRDDDFYFIFGVPTGITLTGYQGEANNVSFQGTKVSSSIGQFSYSTTAGTSVVLLINQNQYVFNLKDGENFYFVIAQQSGGENNVVTG